MILHLDPEASVEAIDRLKHYLQEKGVRLSTENSANRLAVLDKVDYTELARLPGVQKVVPFSHSFKLASRELTVERRPVDLGGVVIGGDQLVIMAGPCSIESEELLDQTAAAVAKSGGQILRGGAFKPRSSPYSFQGLGRGGLEIMQRVGKRHGLLTVSEVLDTESVDLVSSYVDILQIGSRNMQNFSLLRRVGQGDKPVLLKRGASATYEELLLAAEYILEAGNQRVVLCERGIRTFESRTRNTLDIAAVPMLQQLSHLPVIVDPSHGSGRRELVAPLARGAVAAGADGVMIEIHPDPDRAVSDAQQTLGLLEYSELTPSLFRIQQEFK